MIFIHKNYTKHKEESKEDNFKNEEKRRNNLPCNQCTNACKLGAN
jgi:hypothetical protein